MRLAILTLAVVALILPAAANPDTHWSWPQAYWRAEHRARDLQARLTVRVREVRRLEREAKRAQGMRTLSSRHEPGAMYAIRLASAAFGVPYREMLAVARCETGGSFSPYERNASTASGLFQWLDSSWAREGIAGFSVFDPIANALAAARTVAREGWGQWVCKP